MRSDIFYRTEHDATVVPIEIIAEDHTLAVTLSSKDWTSLTTQGFQAAAGDVGLIMNDAGALAKVYLGCGRGQDADAIAMGMSRLPAGVYQVTSLSHRAALVWSLAQYRFDHYKKVDSQPRVLVLDKQTLSYVLPEAKAIFLIRNLINRPTNTLGPNELATEVSRVAEIFGARFEQWVGDELLTHNFPAIHAVGRASAEAPRLLSLTWGNPSHPRVALVGKGVCFDSGGLDVKPSSGMRLMKKDMGGAAHVLGLAQWMMERKLPVYLHVLIPAVENAIGSRAYRPGDVLTMRNGLTVEIDNTDAEGRLVLADAFVKAHEFKPELLIDFATLTGAARVAVGTDIAAMFSNDDDVAEAILHQSSERQDPVWRMPLFSGYEDLIKSSIADVANSSHSSYAGAITAALFLQRFIPPQCPWVHFDMMAWNVSSKPGKPEGGEAMAVLATGQYLIQRYQG